MTKGTIKAEGDEFFLKLEGHAAGSEPVCAAISSLVYALAGYLQNAALKGEAEIHALALESGKAEIRCRGGKEAKGAYQMAASGLMQLEKKYPQLISVKIKADADVR